MLIWFDRSLTKKQRDILQLYVDDIEGRSSAPKTPADITSKNESQADNADRDQMGLENGTASFTCPSPSPKDGRVSRVFNRIRGLIGL